MKAKDLKISYDQNMQPVVSVTLASRQDVSNLQTLADLGKPLSVEVKVLRKKRSVDANSYYWTLITQLSDLMGISQEELHTSMILKYGHSDLLGCVECAVPSIKSAYKIVVEKGEFWTDKGVLMKRLLCYKSSSQYNTKEFSILLQGLIEECHEQGISTITQKEIDTLMELYGRR